MPTRVLRRRRNRADTPVEPQRELAARHCDGVHVSLLWRPADDAVAVSLADARSGQAWTFPVDPLRALDAFYHPFAYVP